MKRRIGYFLGVIVIVIFLAIGISYKMSKEESETALRNVLGNSIYKVWEGYDSIIEDSSKEMTIESIDKMNGNLVHIEAKSSVVDRTVGENLLQPIASKLWHIGKEIEESYYENDGFNEEQEKRYKEIVDEMKKINKQIIEIYYIPGSEGGVYLEIENFEELEEIKKRLH